MHSGQPACLLAHDLSLPCHAHCSCRSAAIALMDKSCLSKPPLTLTDSVFVSTMRATDRKRPPHHTLAWRTAFRGITALCGMPIFIRNLHRSTCKALKCPASDCLAISQLSYKEPTPPNTSLVIRSKVCPHAPADTP